MFTKINSIKSQWVNPRGTPVYIFYFIIETLGFHHINAKLVVY